MTRLLCNTLVSSLTVTSLYHIKFRGDSMSEALVTQNNALQLGGVGMGASIFKARPMMLEMVHTTTRQEGAIPGQFRVISTNEHLGSTIRVVLLAVPQEQREYFEGAAFTKESKQ